MAIGLTLIALAATLTFEDALTSAVAIFFFLAITVSAWLSGLGPGLLATALSVVLLNYFVFSPKQSWTLLGQDIVVLAIFGIVAALVSWLTEVRRRAVAELRASARTLEAALARRTAAEDALRTTRDRLRLAQEAGGVGVWDWDAATDRTYWSDSMWALYGLAPAATGPGNDVWLPRLHPEDRTRVETAIADLLASAEIEYRDEFRVVQPDGTERTIEAIARVMRDEAGRPTRMSGVNLDVTDRRRAEAAARTHDERLRRAAEAARIVIWEWDPAADRVVTTDNIGDIYGRSPVAAAADGFALVHPEDQERHLAVVQGAAAAGTGYHSEFRVVRPDTGATVWIEERAYAENADGDRRVLGVAVDITERKAAEAALAASEAHARFLAGASEVLASALDLDEAARRVVELAVPRLADWCVIDLLGPDGALHREAIVHRDPGKMAAAATLRQRYPTIAAGAAHTTWKVLRSGETWFDPEVATDRFVAEARDHDHLALLRELGFVSELVTPLVARGHALGVLTLVHGESGRRYRAEDVTIAEDLARHCALAIDNARLYREARAAEAKVGRLFDAGVIGLIVADGERVIEANDRFLAMTGYTRDDLAAGLPRWETLRPAEFRDLDERARAEMATRGFCTPVEMEYARKDGSRVPVLTGGAAVQGTTAPWIHGVVDLTALKTAERDRIAFVDDATHDLKNPLTSLKAQTQMLLRRSRRGVEIDAATLETSLVAIDDAAARMIRLIDDLVDAARLRAGEPLALNQAPVDLVALVERCIETYRETTSMHEFRLFALVGTLMGTWDAGRLERVVSNLLTNAIKYSPAGGPIDVWIDREDDGSGGEHAVTTVRDRGIGIPAEDLDRVFERFQRGSNVGAIRGTGVGLAGARQIVEQHGGTIVAMSEDGAGAAFTVRLPLTE